MVLNKQQADIVAQVIGWDDLAKLAQTTGQQNTVVIDSRNAKIDFVRRFGLKNDSELAEKIANRAWVDNITASMIDKINGKTQEFRNEFDRRPAYTSRPTRTEYEMFSFLCECRGIFGRWVLLAYGA